MTDFSALLQQGNAWLFIPGAIALGALHGLEPGHSKTMMAAFIIAVKGTVRQAVMLGLAATLSHTLIVWLIALGGMYISTRFTPEAVEPWLQMVSAVIILATAFWMFMRTYRGEKNWLTEMQQENHTHHHHHDHDHDHGHHDHDHHHHHDDEYQDAHARAHAHEIKTRFTGGKATNSQVLLFGLTGGLIPCPAAITVLLICLQLKAFTLGATMVLSFSIGLALTLVTVGVVTAVGLRQVSRRWQGLSDIAQKAPYFSAALIALVGLYMGIHGYMGLAE
ncbi:nickel/cobalt efflux transporter RcnA [Morganella morganii]|uniref:nickel/cobalt efflux transporter n=1 Tax=Morganella morganii TaxID=582 RepID=UPI000D1F5EB5|nr:nickel/cobalt efflux transporter [Morganella morganii]HAE77179.1 nickel/cobalt efflux protein RcnA [Morganella sp. (in: enterobacteria)]QXO41678.1 nickel/cobalt efflux transporter RcnA [Morganella morganii]QXO48893.1 nickel/cobalt efflux transporter RcnA [Morganella morganii]QXO52754.1 nickel/cobalt efflux transporter RcnA [Morganella morganii]QXO56603.1 nickel/cobalt efflux transporter RcnA [Morganella morganii]